MHHVRHAFFSHYIHSPYGYTLSFQTMSIKYATYMREVGSLVNKKSIYYFNTSQTCRENEYEHRAVGLTSQWGCNLVESFIGALVMVEAAGLGATAHRVPTKRRAHDPPGGFEIIASLRGGAWATHPPRLHPFSLHEGRRGNYSGGGGNL